MHTIQNYMLVENVDIIGVNTETLNLLKLI